MAVIGDSWVPGDVEPKTEFVTHSATTDKTSITKRIEVSLTRNDMADGGRPWVGGFAKIVEKVGQLLLQCLGKLEFCARVPNNCCVVACNKLFKAVDEGEWQLPQVA